MPRLINPVGWLVSEQSPESGEAMPLLSLENDKGNRLMISPVDRCLVRVVHSGPDVHDTTLGLKDRDGIRWEKRRASWSVEVRSPLARLGREPRQLISAPDNRSTTMPSMQR